MFLGLDLGTSGVKALVLDEAQAVLAEAHAPLSVSRPRPGWSEQSPADWLTATAAAIDDIAAQIDMARIAGIGLSGQMHGAVLLDGAGDVLRPCILWNDSRAAEEAAEMDADPQWRAISANIVFPGFTAPKLEWVRRNEPEIFSRTSLVLLPKDFLRLWLTGKAVSEPSDASGTNWLDPTTRDWSDTLLAASGLTRNHMPRLVDGTARSGTLRGELARRWGLGENVPVAGGGGDNEAAGVGVGVVRPGDAFVTLGTSGAIFVVTDKHRPDPATAVHAFCHALPDTWHQMGCILSGGDALEWFSRLAGQGAAELSGGLGRLRAPGRAMFLPYLGGERTPHNDTKVRAAMIGLEHTTDAQAGTRAVIEGVTFALRDCFDVLRATGTEVERLVAVGGGSRSDYWLHAIATAMDRPVDRLVDGDFGAAFGAARLGMMVATGQGVDIATRPRVAQTFEPDPALVPAFADAQARYRASYHALKDLS
ncbi:MAG: xylulokinase [Brevirhabdus sp.]